MRPSFADLRCGGGNALGHQAQRRIEVTYDHRRPSGREAIQARSFANLRVDVCTVPGTTRTALAGRWNRARQAAIGGVRITDSADCLPALRAAMAAPQTTVLDAITKQRAYSPGHGI
jgi:hypothetical protein